MIQKEADQEADLSEAACCETVRAILTPAVRMVVMRSCLVGSWLKDTCTSEGRKEILYQLAWGIQPVQTWLPWFPLFTLKSPETLFTHMTSECY